MELNPKLYEKGVKEIQINKIAQLIKFEMCLYPRIMKNPKYKANNKNGGIIPEPKDQRIKAVAIGCGNCEECLKQKSREWQVRLQEELKVNRGIFITLTFTEESLKELETAADTKEANTIATLAVRRFLERWRKKHKKSVRHWLITELGHENTERIHLHGIIFTDKPVDEIDDLWKYGNIWIGAYCNSRTVNYIIKYVTKIDKDHKGYKPKILCSHGIGNNYVNTWNAKQNKFKEDETNETYRLNNGQKTALPIYYRNKIYTEEEREKLWIKKLDQEQRFILGSKIPYKTLSDKEKFHKSLEYHQQENIKKGYGNLEKEWSKKEYLTSLNKLRNEKFDQ